MYPEHEKLKKLDRECEGAQRVLEWLESKGYFIAEYTNDTESDDWCAQVHISPSTLIGQALGIDEEELENEKRAMLDAIRNTRLGSAR